MTDRKYIVPAVTSSDYVRMLNEICQREQIHRVFPLIDPDIPVLAENRHRIESSITKLAVVSKEASAITNDKWLTTQFFRGLGLRTPNSWLPDDFEVGDAKYPLFIKPRNGSASIHAYRVMNRKEFDFFVKYVPNPIIQECIEGVEITNDVVCDITGEVLGVVSRQRIEVRWGEVAKGVTIYDKAITDACVEVAKRLPAIGPITVQCLLKDHIPHFTEINARLGGGVPLGIAAGVDSPKWLLARAAGIAIEIPAIGTYKTGLYITRYDDSFFLDEVERERMASHHL